MSMTKAEREKMRDMKTALDLAVAGRKEALERQYAAEVVARNTRWHTVYGTAMERLIREYLAGMTPRFSPEAYLMPPRLAFEASQIADAAERSWAELHSPTKEPA